MKSYSGALRISNDVVIKIVELAAMEISGVATKNGHLEAKENPILIANRLVNPIRATLRGDAAEIDISIVVEAGHKAVKVAESVQQSVKSAVQNMTGIIVAKVNVRIIGTRVPLAGGQLDEEVRA
jgi:uncharacterized alkaline shock family protein YloU